MALTINEQIEQQEKKAAEARKKIADLKHKAKTAETKRFTRLADKHGYFDVDVSDEQLTDAIKQLVSAARAQ